MGGGGARGRGDEGAGVVVEGSIVAEEAAERVAPAAISRRAPSHVSAMVVIVLTGIGFIAAAARLFSAPPTTPREVREVAEENTAPTAVAPEIPRRFVPPPAPLERRGIVSADDEGDAPGANQDLRDALARGRAAAQACAGVTPHSSHAMLRFGADGAVEKVVVAPPYAGTATEACIERAFRAASLPTGRGRAFSATAGF
jgi:hypothetical protein